LFIGLIQERYEKDYIRRLIFKYDLKYNFEEYIKLKKTLKVIWLKEDI